MLRAPRRLPPLPTELAALLAEYREGHEVLFPRTGTRDAADPLRIRARLAAGPAMERHALRCRRRMAPGQRTC